MSRYKFRSKLVTVGGDQWGSDADVVEKTCNEWAKEGFIVFSVVCPQPSNYTTYRLTARRDNEEAFTPSIFKEES